MAERKAAVSKRNRKASETMSIKAYMDKMTPDTVEAHASHLVKNNPPEKLLAFRKYISEVLDSVNSALKESGWVPDKENKRHYGFDLAKGNRPYIKDQEPTEAMVKLKKQITGLKAQQKALQKQYDTLAEAEVIKGNGEKVDNIYFIVSYPKDEK